GAAGVALLAGACVLVVVLLAGAGGRRLRAAIAALLVLAVVGVVGVAAGDAVRIGISRPRDWQVGMCDVGQGDASLVQSDGLVAMIDTGREPALAAKCLSELGITHIDLLVLTHYDLDHVGGTSAVYGRVTRALVGPRAGPDDDRLVRQLEQHGAHVEQASRGMSGVLGELRWDVLWPKARLGSVEPGNPASVTVTWGPAGRCPGGCLTSIFLGDLGEQPQSLMMAANRLGQVDLVKVAHHGSADQYPPLYERLRASVGLIGVGAHNEYGHPTPRLLGVLHDVGTTIARTDEEGMLLVTPVPGGGMTLWTERAPTDLLRPGRSRAGGPG
ncbi:MAG: ComEC/Rec2 family competence protein, partial [Microbacteriaceae bacterium]|nr:ComEC/Rec2 family competence protein [Microbacteriaceae bacterium]